MPFGCEGVWLTEEIQTIANSFARSPMPFGCEGVWLFDAYYKVEWRDEKSPMPFGCEGVWLLYLISNPFHTMKSLQCLSAVRGFGCHKENPVAGRKQTVSNAFRL